MMVAGYTGWLRPLTLDRYEQIYLPALLRLVRHHSLGLTLGSQVQGHGDKGIFLDLRSNFYKKKEKSFQEFLRGFMIDVNLHIERRPKHEASRVAGDDLEICTKDVP